MYIKIKDNVISDWADWNFEGSHFVDIDYEYYSANKDRFKLIDGVLTDISNSEEYLASILEKAKINKKQENKIALENKTSISTTFGSVNINTPIGRVDVMVTGFLNIVNITKENLPEGSFRFYVDGVETQSPELTPAQVASFYVEVFSKLNECDKTYKQYEKAINEAKSCEEIESINIDYSSI